MRRGRKARDSQASAGAPSLSARAQGGPSRLGVGGRAAAVDAHADGAEHVGQGEAVADLRLQQRADLPRERGETETEKRKGE